MVYGYVWPWRPLLHPTGRLQDPHFSSYKFSILYFPYLKFQEILSSKFASGPFTIPSVQASVLCTYNKMKVECPRRRGPTKAKWKLIAPGWGGYSHRQGRGSWFNYKAGRGAGKARFNVATPTNATVTCTAYVLPYNFQTKSIQHYFKRGSTLNLDGFSVKIIFHII